MFVLFTGGRETSIDCADVSSSAIGQETVTAVGQVPDRPTVDPVQPPVIPTAHTSDMLVREPNHNPVESSGVFNEEVADQIAQVHCENELFEFELTDHSPCVNNAKGNLRRNLEFWKCIGTSKFIISVIERGYMLPFLSLPVPAVFRNNRSSLAHADFVEDAC